MVLALSLELHRLVAESLLEVGKVVHVALLASKLRVDTTGWTDAHFLLLLKQHVFLHQSLLKLLSQSKALVDVHGQLNFDFLGLRELDVALELLDESVLLLYLELQISVVLLELAYDERLSKMVALASRCLGAQGHAVTLAAWLCHRLLEAHRELLKLLVSLIELVLDLLQLGLQSDVLILGHVVCDLQVSIMVLQVLLLHLHEVVEGLCLRVLLRAEYHLSQLLALHLIKLLGHAAIQHREAACRQLLGLRSSIRHISHDISSHRGTTELSATSAGHHLLLHEHAVSPIHLLLWVHASTVGLLLHLLVLVSHFVVLRLAIEGLLDVVLHELRGLLD